VEQIGVLGLLSGGIEGVSGKKLDTSEVFSLYTLSYFPV
jgi:hypothetical protein